jgi:hypothetical protein
MSPFCHSNDITLLSLHSCHDVTPLLSRCCYSSAVVLVTPLLSLFCHITRVIFLSLRCCHVSVIQLLSLFCYSSAVTLLSLICCRVGHSSAVTFLSLNLCHFSLTQLLSRLCHRTAVTLLSFSCCHVSVTHLTYQRTRNQKWWITLCLFNDASSQTGLLLNCYFGLRHPIVFAIHETNRAADQPNTISAVDTRCRITWLHVSA